MPALRWLRKNQISRKLRNKALYAVLLETVKLNQCRKRDYRHHHHHRHYHHHLFVHKIQKSIK